MLFHSVHFYFLQLCLGIFKSKKYFEFVTSNFKDLCTLCFCTLKCAICLRYIAVKGDEVQSFLL
jgi:hypothetical protein